MKQTGENDSSEHVCYHCGGACFTSNTAWFICDLCGEQVWIDFSHPHAPPKIAVRKAVSRGG